MTMTPQNKTAKKIALITGITVQDGFYLAEFLDDIVRYEDIYERLIV